jgi:hypothetical protein
MIGSTADGCNDGMLAGYRERLVIDRCTLSRTSSV